jgi:cytochrome c oxidase subunit 2
MHEDAAMMLSLAAFVPHSPGAQETLNLGIIATIVFAIIFVLVGAAITYSLLRYRWQEGEADPKQIAGNKTVEIVWTAIPLAIVLLLFAMTARTMSKVDPPPPAKADLIVTGHQFWWEARYTTSGAVVANEIHIPAGKPFAVQLESADVIHEFWVEGVSRKIQAIPGQTTYLWLEADKPGTYTGVCAEFCGVQHAWMRFVVVAEEPAQFAVWEQTQVQPAQPPVDPIAAQGLALFRGMSCVSCHAVNGVPGADARVAPDLTHLASRSILGGGVCDNSPQNLRRWLENPQTVKPGVLMPNYYLTDKQLSQLVAYFETLK